MLSIVQGPKEDYPCQEMTICKHRWDRRCLGLMTWKNVAPKPQPCLSSYFCEALKTTLQVLFSSLGWKLNHKIVYHCQKLSQKYAYFYSTRVNFTWEGLLEVETKMSLLVLCGNKKLVFLWTHLSLGSWHASAKFTNFNPPAMEGYSTKSSGCSVQNESSYKVPSLLDLATANTLGYHPSFCGMFSLQKGVEKYAVQ